MVQAFILVQTEVGRSKLVADALGTVDGVVSAESVLGPYDVIVRAEGMNEAALADIVSRVQKVDSITRTLSCQIADSPSGTSDRS